MISWIGFGEYSITKSFSEVDCTKYSICPWITDFWNSQEITLPRLSPRHAHIVNDYYPVDS